MQDYRPPSPGAEAQKPGDSSADKLAPEAATMLEELMLEESSRRPPLPLRRLTPVAAAVAIEPRDKDIFPEIRQRSPRSSSTHSMTSRTRSDEAWISLGGGGGYSTTNVSGAEQDEER